MREDVSEVIALHQAGLLAVRTLDNPLGDAQFYQAKPLYNDRRNCSAESSSIKSATLLPKQQYPIHQCLFGDGGYFIGLKVIAADLRDAGFDDIFSNSSDGSTLNSKGRTTKIGTCNSTIGTLFESRHAMQSGFIDAFDDRCCTAVETGQTKLNWNEILLKLHLQSPACLGITTDSMTGDADQIIGLFALQQYYFDYWGIQLPIVIYNTLSPEQSDYLSIQKLLDDCKIATS